MQITIDELKINYVTKGEGDDILFLHGWGSSVDAFRHIMSHLSERFRVTALDFPGFGGSDMPKNAWSVADYADLTAKFIQNTGLKNPVLVGHSFGGRVTIYLCGKKMAEPEKIILLDAAGIKHQPTRRQKMRSKTFKFIKKLLSVKLWASAAEPLLNKARAHYGSADYNAAPPIMRETLVKTVNEDLTPLLSSIKASSLLIYGENDTATPVADAKIMEREIPDAGLCVINGAGHFSFIDRPRQVDAIIDSFLNG